MTSTNSWLGVTPPIAKNGPTPRGLEVTDSLLAELRDQKTFESAEEAKVREVVLGKVDAMVKDFVYRASLSHGMSDSIARTSGGKIFTFGSYRLGVHGPGSDIDTLCVVPKHIQREDFFNIFEDMLRKREEVTEVAPVPEAYVPVIGAKFMGISIDFLFARLALPRIDDSLDLSDTNILKNLDERDVRSLGGSRVTDDILRLVPNVEVFRTALRCIKLWAQRRAIYSNIMGFLGGVAWAMLTARICQLYPNEAAGTIVSRFFMIMYQWNWPQPVLLKPIEEGPLQVRVWNPKLYPQDRLHRMPIITPAYPSMCSTHNVTQSTQMIMTQEFKIAAEVVDRVMVKKAEWSELFKKHDFFYKYKYYLQIIASSGSADLQLKWSGTVESKVRQLIMKLELVPTVLCAHPYTKGFDQMSECHTNDEVRAVATGDVPEEVAARTKLEALPKEPEAAKEQDEAVKQADAEEGHRTIWTTTFFIGLCIEPRQADVTGPRKLDISYPTNEFTRLVKQWEPYDEKSMGIVVRHIKCSQLPEYVFAGDERPPAKQLKRSKSGKAKKSKESGGAAVAAGEANGSGSSLDANGEGTPSKKRKSALPTGGDANGAAGEISSAGPTTPSTSASTITSGTIEAGNGNATAEPSLRVQEETAQSELENFKLATGGSVPASVSIGTNP